MLKKIGIRKAIITSSAFLILLLVYLFPTNNTVNLEKKVTYGKTNTCSVYLFDKYDYVSLTNVEVKKEKDSLKKAKTIINVLTEGKSKNIPSGFKPIIPKNTKVLSVKLYKNTIYLNFTKEFLNLDKNNEEGVIEALVYSLTELNGINNVRISVEGKVLRRLPNSGKIIPEVLNRELGVNKEFDITTLENINKTTVYYVNKNVDGSYYIPVTKVTNDPAEKISVIIDELKTSLVYQSNLSSYLNAEAELKKYEIKEDVMYLTFNDKIFDNIENGNILEEVKYTIGKSIMDNYNVSEVVYLVNDKEITKTTLKNLEN